MKLQVIVGSIREGRVTNNVAHWVANEAKKTMQDAEVEVVDLADYSLPLFNEAISPQYNPDRKPEGVVKDFLNKLAEADGFIIVTPEYNRTIPGVLNNAIDYIAYEFAQKPIALVAHGTTGGAQAVSHLRGILAGTLAISVPQATMIAARVGTFFNEDGTPTGDVSQIEGMLHTTLESLDFYAQALLQARQLQASV